ncbi:MAG TPA: hypothetical protein VFD82_07090 [Planctomycetota bacterium]|nr:hypothetical protein [Planctomycetota bacterium]
MKRVPQPTPDVTAADVERIVRRDFPPSQQDNALAMLHEYCGESHRGADRVRLAVLKLANKNLKQLRYWVEQAKLDYRDVLSPAEYPKYCRWGRVDTASEDEQRKVIDSDWAQYERWLKG